MTAQAIEIIWDSASVAVVLKPAGLATQSPSPHDSLENRLRAQFADRSSYIAFPHRLDRPVSGLILVAFTKKAARLLGEQFEARRVTKAYLALVQGAVAIDKEHWSDHLRKRESEAHVDVVAFDKVSSSPEVKLAELDMTVLRRWEDRTLVELTPITGRMHQLRVQTASRGHAIVGDAQYGSQCSDPQIAPGTIALHAWKLDFHDPANGRRMRVEAPAPDWISGSN
jgi:23S rRNA-/tRNA-specific pseudouridylate synthase